MNVKEYEATLLRHLADEASACAKEKIIEPMVGRFCRSNQDDAADAEARKVDDAVNNVVIRLRDLANQIKKEAR